MMSESRFKVGDFVRVKSREDIEQTLEDDDVYSDWCDAMSAYADLICKVVKIDNFEVYLEQADGQETVYSDEGCDIRAYYWLDCWLEHYEKNKDPKWEEI